jgi:hypothetical protein
LDKLKKEILIMMNKNERMEKLNEMGINTDKYFTVALDNGTQVHLIIDENGNPKKVDDVICNQIIEDGYVRNTKLHRRFVMAQMFQALNYVSWDRKRTGYNEWLKNFGIKYQFDMMLEEIRVLGKLEERDTETFLERSNFFTKDVIIKTMADYIEKLKVSIEIKRTYKCKGISYKKVAGRDIFVDDLDKKIYAPMRTDIYKVKIARNYNEIYKAVKNFMSKMITVPYYTTKSKDWIDAYKGEGAFYTLKNLVMFHGCGIEVGYKMVYGTEAVKILNERLYEYKGEGWRMFALMKKVIADNNFDFQKRMNEIYGK